MCGVEGCYTDNYSVRGNLYKSKPPLGVTILALVECCVHGFSFTLTWSAERVMLEQSTGHEI